MNEIMNECKKESKKERKKVTILKKKGCKKS